MGHTKVRCKQAPAPAEDSGFDAGFNGDGDAANGTNGGFDATATGGGGDGPEPTSNGNGWEQGQTTGGNGWEQRAGESW